jgi:protein TonB
MVLFLRNVIWAGFALLLLTTSAVPAAARRVAAYSVTGHVRNKSGLALAGVVISMQGGATVQTGASVTATNGEGAFYLSCANAEPPVLTLKYAGYQTQTFRITAKGPVSITLYETGTPILPQVAGVEMVVEAPETPDVAATFPGGNAAYQAFMKQNQRYPRAAQQKELTGTVLVSFTVDEQGRILDPQVASGVDGLNEEALRLVSTMPWWTPARRQGRPVRSSSYLRVRFEFHGE